jgi:hypothetical protein
MVMRKPKAPCEEKPKTPCEEKPRATWEEKPGYTRKDMYPTMFLSEALAGVLSYTERAQYLSSFNDSWGKYGP